MAISFFIGRYQPLHDGHIKLIQSVLNEGKSVTVGLRDTPVDKKNPYTIAERTAMFHKAFGDKVTVVTVPDIEEICYGRGVGYGIREIELDSVTQNISATKIRDAKVIWFSGNSGCGKSTLSALVNADYHLDGDVLRQMFPGLGFSKEDRWKQGIRAAHLARSMRNQGLTVAVSIIAPYRKLRAEIKAICDCRFWYSGDGKAATDDYPYEWPGDDGI